MCMLQGCGLHVAALQCVGCIAQRMPLMGGMSKCMFGGL